ncbi:MAG: molybdopterin guanine dinucleotide-containing S/N-oxide reductase [Candidatus Rokubacteria bacterium]|nr:molybdopterin guanine dinucleotide-containing S/N-oxide reductase [Candidatus Rokubacteria bacterium]
MALERRLHTSHWGCFEAEIQDGAVVAVHPFRHDPDPSPLLDNIPGSLRHRARVTRPMVRAGWLDRGPGPDARRGAEPFVPVSWAKAIELLARELARVYREHGGEAVYGGSYGWASAGRFHHAQSQLHRFLNCLGGFVRGEHTYSNGALTVIMPHVVGSVRTYLDRATAWSVIERHTELFVCVGGIPLKNTMVSPGGASRHPARDHLRAARARGTEFVLLSPIRDDLPDFVGAEWLPVVPGSDVAVLLALAYTLVDEGLHDRAFLARCCVGFERFEAYLLGVEDGCPKTPEWAERLSGIAPATIRALARRMAARRTLINVNYSLQRIEHGEQAPWLGVTLAAMLGQIGLPGGGFGQGYGSLGYVGRAPLRLGPPALPQGANPVRAFIPFARVADMLLHPGEAFDFDGQRLVYPGIRLVYWSGGNPFHHHQHIGRLRRALARPDTIVVHDPFWTPMARHADVVLPATMTLERDDIGGSPNDSCLIAMRRAVAPHGEARNEYAIFSDLAAALGVGARFTEGRDDMAWLRHLYEGWRASLADRGGPALPPFDEFWAAGSVEVPDLESDLVLFDAFRADPERAPLGTPSGRIEIFSATIDKFGYDDCPGHPTWMPPTEWLGSPLAARYPLHLIANNPTTRLHSQLDVGAFSQAAKVQGREPIRLHPTDAAARGIRSGDVVRVFNDRGSCLAGAVVSDTVRPGVVQLSTGAWYDPLDPTDPDSMCVHGNPNVLTFDRGTSRLAQACSGQHCLVEVERWTAPLPPIRAYDPPAIVSRPDAATGS